MVDVIVIMRTKLILQLTSDIMFGAQPVVLNAPCINGEIKT